MNTMNTTFFIIHALINFLIAFRADFTPYPEYKYYFDVVVVLRCIEIILYFSCNLHSSNISIQHNIIYTITMRLLGIMSCLSMFLLREYPPKCYDPGLDAAIADMYILYSWIILLIQPFDIPDYTGLYSTSLYSTSLSSTSLDDMDDGE